MIKHIAIHTNDTNNHSLPSIIVCLDSLNMTVRGLVVIVGVLGLVVPIDGEFDHLRHRYYYDDQREYHDEEGVPV